MINFIRTHSIFRDRQAVALMTAGSVLVLLLIMFVLFMVESRDFKVDVRYSGYNRTLSDKGQWYSLYIFPLFAVLTHVINSYLSLKTHQLQRMMAITILGFNLVVQVFALMVSRSLIGLL